MDTAARPRVDGCMSVERLCSGQDVHTQVGFLVEKTGCDAAVLSAPFLQHGSEAELLREATLQSDPTIHLRFACEELLVCLKNCCSTFI